MFAKVNSFGVKGLAGFAVTAEADISGGLPQLAMHSCFETAGVKDTTYLIQAAEEFFS